jgi:hypothetical protein
MKKREILIIIALVLFGIIYNGVEKGKFDISFGEGCSYERKTLLDKNYPNDYVQEEIQRGNIKKIRIENLAGNIVVEKAPAGDNQVRVQPVICVYNKKRDKADRMLKDIKIVTRTERYTDKQEPPVKPVKENTPGTPGTTGTPAVEAPPTATETLVLSIEPKEKYPFHRVRINFKVTIPETVEVELYTMYGDLKLTDSNANAYLSVNYGDIFAQNIGAKLDVECYYGNLVIENIRDKVDIHSDYSRIDIKDVSALQLFCRSAKVYIEGVKTQTDIASAAYSSIDIENSGKVSIDSRHTGIKLSNIKEGVKIKNSYESIYMEEIQGNIEIATRDCKIELNKAISDKLVITNSYDDIDIDKLTAKNVDITLDHGTLNLAFDKVEEQIDIKNTYSTINLSYPQVVKPVFGIQLEHGDIADNTSSGMTVLKEREKVVSNSTNPGGKPRIVINNTYGDVTLDNKTAEEATATAGTAEKPEKESKIK